MKRILIGLLCVVMLLTVAACGDDQPAEQPDNIETTVPSVEAGDATTVPNPETDATTQGQVNKTEPTQKQPTGTQKPPEDNTVNWEDYFGDDEPTQKTDATEGNKPTDGNKPTETKKPTTTKPTTTAPTKKPTTIDKVTLPAVGTDVDGKGRIAVSKVTLDKGVLTLAIRNNTDKQTQKWITEETNYVTYACYDKDGNPLKGKDASFGYFYIGCLEAGKDIEFKVTLPAGTARVELTGAKIVYWTPWS